MNAQALTQTSKDKDSRCDGSAQSYKRTVVRSSGSLVARHLGVMQTLARVAVEGDRLVAKDIVDELVHCRLAERAPLTRLALKRAWALDLFSEEVVNVYDQLRRIMPLKSLHALTLPSSPHKNRPGIQAQSIFSHR